MAQCCEHDMPVFECRICYPTHTLPRVFAMSTAVQRVVDELRELPPEAVGRVLVAAAVILGREDLAKLMLGRVGERVGLAEVLGTTDGKDPAIEGAA